VLSQIEQRIADGRLGPGDRLPGERELAERLGVSRAGVREALRVLEALGVLSSGVGSGPGAGSVVRSEGAEGADALANLLRLQLALARFTLGELAEVRTRLDLWARSPELAGNALVATLATALRRVT
jgi:DNA-binding FadR family transcriptional regulator